MSSEADFKELCIAVAQLAHSANKLGLTSVKLQMSERDFSALRAEALAVSSDNFGLCKLYSEQWPRQIAGIPVEISYGR